MKKKTLLTLGVCALALGAVVGAVSARNATLAKAGEGDITVYFKDATWWATDGARTGTYLWKGETNNTWPGTVMEKVGTDDGHNIWKATIDTGTYENLIFTRYGATDSSDWGAKSVDIALSDFDPAKPLYDISATTESWGDPGITGTWVAYDEPATTSEEASSAEASSAEASETPVSSEAPVATGLYLRGTAVGGWDVAAANELQPHEGDRGAILNVTFAVGDFKIGNADWSQQWGWKYKNDDEAEDHVTVIGTAKDNFEAAEGVDNNIHCKVAGAYDLYLTNNNYISIEPHGEPAESSEEASSAEASVAPTHADGWYLLGTPNDWKADDDWYTDGDDEGNVAKWLKVDLAKDDVFSFAYSNSDVLDWANGKYFGDLGGGGAAGNFVSQKDEYEHENFKCTVAGTYNIYMTNAYKLYFELDGEPAASSAEASSAEASETPVSSEAPVATGLYLRGTAVGGWDVAAANELQPHEGDRGAILNVTFAVGDFKIGNADWSQQWGWKYKNDDEAEDHVTVIGTAKDNFEAAEGVDNNIHCKVAGAYDVYLTNNNYISIEPHGEPAESSEEASSAEASSAPIVDGYFYVATGNGYEEQYLYTWEGEGGTGHENAKFPGVKLNDIADAYCTEGTNFNDNGGIWKVPASALMEKFKITLKDTNESQPVEERQIETQDIDAAAGIYVAPGAAKGDLNLGAQANVAKAIEDKIVAAENKSVCNVAKADAELLVAAYDALADKTAIDAATYWTYDIDIKDLTDSTPAAANVTYDKLVEQLRFIAEGGNAGAWNVTNATNNIALIITISIVGVGLVGAGALYLISKKRKLQK